MSTRRIVGVTSFKNSISWINFFIHFRFIFPCMITFLLIVPSIIVDCTINNSSLICLLLIHRYLELSRFFETFENLQCKDSNILEITTWRSIPWLPGWLRMSVWACCWLFQTACWETVPCKNDRRNNDRLRVASPNSPNRPPSLPPMATPSKHNQKAPMNTVAPMLTCTFHNCCLGLFAGNAASRTENWNESKVLGYLNVFFFLLLEKIHILIIVEWIETGTRSSNYFECEMSINA